MESFEKTTIQSPSDKYPAINSINSMWIAGLQALFESFLMPAYVKSIQESGFCQNKFQSRELYIIRIQKTVKITSFQNKNASFTQELTLIEEPTQLDKI